MKIINQILSHIKNLVYFSCIEIDPMNGTFYFNERKKTFGICLHLDYICVGFKDRRVVSHSFNIKLDQLLSILSNQYLIFLSFQIIEAINSHICQLFEFLVCYINLVKVVDISFVSFFFCEKNQLT